MDMYVAEKVVCMKKEKNIESAVYVYLPLS